MRAKTTDAAGDLTVERVELTMLPTCLSIRHAVFVVGQGVPLELEVDGQDERCSHFLATLDGEPVGTARLLPSESGQGKAQRVAVLAGARGSGIGAALMRRLYAEASRLGCREVVLDSQVEAIPFYERLGYVAEGPTFVDAGIDHRRMRKPIR